MYEVHINQKLSNKFINLTRVSLTDLVFYGQYASDAGGSFISGNSGYLHVVLWVPGIYLNLLFKPIVKNYC